MIIREKEPANLEMAFGELKSFITPNDQFYVRSHFALPQIDLAHWRLRIEGAVVDGADRVGPFAQDDFFDRIRRALAVVRNLAVLAAVFEAVRYFDEPRNQRSVLRAALGLPARRQCRARRAVIIQFAL